MYAMGFIQVVSIGYFKGGQARNVIPESVEFGGTYRSLSPEGLIYLKDRINEVSNSVDIHYFLVVLRSSLALGLHLIVIPIHAQSPNLNNLKG